MVDGLRVAVEGALRQVAVGALEVEDAQADLLEVVDALGAAGGLAGRLHRRQQQADQHGDDRDHHQQLDQGEARTTMPGPGVKTHGMIAPWDHSRGMSGAEGVL